MQRPRYDALIRRIDPDGSLRSEVAELEERYDGDARPVAVALGLAFPAWRAALTACPDDLLSLLGEDVERARRRPALRVKLEEALSDVTGDDALERLRQMVRREKMRIALRELLGRELGAGDVDVTAGELSALADISVQGALRVCESDLAEGLDEEDRTRLRNASFCVLGMGKLGGQELNAGSDIDLIYIYDDERSRDADRTFELVSRLAKRLTRALEEPSPEGFLWRVDLRLRPDGQSGPLVISLSAAERYYEAVGRLWERAALLRARPVAGDAAFGRRFLYALEPFVWRRAIDPSIAPELIRMTQRARAELSHAPERDLKLGPGGIREVEFFVQTLCLIWGGREPSLRVAHTLAALQSLGRLGYVTDREGVEMFDAYLALRRAEHRVQWATGVQTHCLPEEPGELDRVARSLGFSSGAPFWEELEAHRARVHARFLSLAPDLELLPSRWMAAMAALDRGDRDAFVRAVESVFRGDIAGSHGLDVEHEAPFAAHLFALAEHPEGLLGGRTRERYPALPEIVLDAILEAPDPGQAARYLAHFSKRMRHPEIYSKWFGGDSHTLRRLVATLGASAMVGDALINRPDLGPTILFEHVVPTPESVRADLLGALVEPESVAGPMSLSGGDPDEYFVDRLRRAKVAATVAIALADLAGSIDTSEVTEILSTVAEASLEAALRHTLGSEEPQGFAVLAMGKLGGREIGYGSDLDVIFVHEPHAATDPFEAQAKATKVARKIIRFISMVHPAGPGYELDTRLRPSGNQGMLVTSIDAFARYHRDGDRPRGAAAWERMALLRARACAGDRDLGERAEAIAQSAAYGADAADRGPIAQEIHRIRTRVEREASGERPLRHDIKLGQGGLMDVEFAVQFLQMIHPEPALVATPKTAHALERLAACGELSQDDARALREGYDFLRRLEQRIRIAHADGSHLLDERDPGLVPLARRLGFRADPRRPITEELLSQLRGVKRRVRAAYETVLLGVASRPSSMPPPPPEVSGLLPTDTED